MARYSGGGIPHPPLFELTCAVSPSNYFWLLLGCLAAWLLGCLVAWLLGWLLGRLLVSWSVALADCIVAWSQGPGPASLPFEHPCCSIQGDGIRLQRAPACPGFAQPLVLANIIGTTPVFWAQPLVIENRYCSNNLLLAPFEEQPGSS